MTKYNEEETIIELRNALKDINTLYNKKCINWSGTAKHSHKQYTEIIAEELLNHIDKFDTIDNISRKSSYKRENHSNIKIDCKSNRDEEKFAKKIIDLELDTLGLITDYQIPLKDTMENKGIGKIDLISHNKESKRLFLIELKYKGNKDTLLRAILESYTYSKIVDTNKLKKDFLSSVNPHEIIPSILLVKGCKSYNELKEMEDDKRPHLRSLSKKLGIKLFTIEFMINESKL